MLLGGRRKQQPTINGSVKTDGRPEQEQAVAGKGR